MRRSQQDGRSRRRAEARRRTASREVTGHPGPDAVPAARSTGRTRTGALAATLLLASGLLAACGGGDGGTPTLTWYINPDSGGQAEIAKRCTEASEGQYRIEVAQLPRESSEQRQQLVRRLAANDSSIDLMSLDPPYIPELAEAGFLAPVPEEVASRVSEDVVEVALTGSTWKDELVAIPFWANTQLLWYKKSVAEAAGLDVSKPITWQQLIEAAQEPGHLPRRPGHPGRGAHRLGERPRRVGRRVGHHRPHGRSGPDRAGAGRRARPAGRAGHQRHRPRHGWPARRSPPPARTPT